MVTKSGPRQNKINQEHLSDKNNVKQNNVDDKQWKLEHLSVDTGK